jgi:hypothetical protein
MKKTTNLILPLTGGLGNQLFQYAAGLAVQGDRNLILESSMGKPRINGGGEPQILEFTLANNVVFMKKNRSTEFISKVFGYNLRTGISRRQFEEYNLVKKLTRAVSGLLFKSRYAIVVNSGVGFSQITESTENSILIGYFQTFIWPSEPKVREKLNKIILSSPSKEIAKYRDLAEEEKPLVVHVRLGDYKNESSFGILSDQYYEEAIADLMEKDTFNKIWLFSDEADSALEKIPIRYRGMTRIMPEIAKSASQTLEVMRFGRGYVIANSTFSWWGAYLSYSESAKIVAPSPWFKGMCSPEMLIPDHWGVKNGFTKE